MYTSIKVTICIERETRLGSFSQYNHVKMASAKLTHIHEHDNLRGTQFIC